MAALLWEGAFTKNWLGGGSGESGFFGVSWEGNSVREALCLPGILPKVPHCLVSS